ncbi:hypothetical protein Taro_021985 [Colocasia esculenta]|uniref:OB domain-containing protein n=1 Tax=Colocasia esculenta TaxID=4460 RepID=A0A843V715_COLES|nr:hypothetical protein [Colocasia esculenta]
MYSQMDGPSLFSGGGFMPSQATQAPDSGASPARNRGAQGVTPLTVKQISEAYHLSDDKSNFVVDGVDVTNARLVGLVTNKVERVTDVSFTLDDGTGRIDINRWVNESSDANEMANILNGMYVKVNGQLKGFHGKKHVVAFSIRPITNFDDVTLHFIDCIYVHLHNTGSKSVEPLTRTSLGTGTPYQSGAAAGYQAPAANQFPAPSGSKGSDDVLGLVLKFFNDPANLDAISYHVDAGNIYSTIDDYHFKSAMNG